MCKSDHSISLEMYGTCSGLSTSTYFGILQCLLSQTTSVGFLTTHRQNSDNLDTKVSIFPFSNFLFYDNKFNINP